jgi:hypothetical protein
MSINTVIAIQMKITQAKKMRMSQRTFRKGYDAAITNLVRLRFLSLPYPCRSPWIVSLT